MKLERMSLSTLASIIILQTSCCLVGFIKAEEPEPTVPAYILRRNRMKREQDLKLAAILGTGLCIVIVGIVCVSFWCRYFKCDEEPELIERVKINREKIEAEEKEIAERRRELLGRSKKPKPTAGTSGTLSPV